MSSTSGVKDNITKKRRTLKAEPVASNSSAPTEVKKGRDKNQAAYARQCFYQEEEEACNRSPEEDIEIHRNALDEIRKMMGEIHELKSVGKITTEATADRRIHGSLQFIILKKINRMMHMRCKKVRDTTHEAKQKIDLYHLQLQNLLYEIMHLEKEITKCLEFRSKDEEIDLISVDEFYNEAPSDISKPDKTTLDEHQQRLARLDYELEQRKRQAENLAEMKKTKDNILEEIKKKKEYIESLNPKLNTILESTIPVQQQLNLPFNDIQEQFKTAYYLPTPLYVLHMLATGYKDACDAKLEIKIEGDLDEAKAVRQQSQESDDDSDSDQGEEEEDKKKRKRRRTRKDNLKAERRNQILKKHPLSVILDVKVDDSTTLILTFYYLLKLNILTVKSTVNHSKDMPNTIAAGDLLQPESLLENLYPGDDGHSSPNPANAYQLRRIDIQQFKECVSETGKPYIWTQWLGGLQFLQDGSVEKQSPETVCSSKMENTIKMLKKRVKARISLQKEISALEHKSVTVSSQFQKWYPLRINSRILSWKKSCYEDYISYDYTKHLKDNSILICESDLFYTAVIENGSAVITAQVVINPDYPNIIPMFALNMSWKSDRNATNDDNIRIIEAEVNIFIDELLGKSHSEVLTNQIQRLLMCFDVYLETESVPQDTEGPSEFTLEKMFPRLSRGPERSKPYRFIPQSGFFPRY